VKLACVIHRFGADIAGGSEAHCRQIAERLAERHEVTVLTSTARDHVTWRNEYPAGESTLGRVRVLRFLVARQRDRQQFADLSERAARPRATDAEQEAWFVQNGPDVPELLAHLRTHGRQYDFVLFWAFRYAEVFLGVPIVAERAILVPTAEEDPVINYGRLSSFFSRPAGYVFLTPEEQALVERHVPDLPPSCVIGAGLDPVMDAPTISLESYGVKKPFLLYLGRVDPNKGCETLFKHFVRYAGEVADPLPLVLAGPANMPIPNHQKIVTLGFVEERVREALLAQAALLVVPSRYESLSLVLLEAWNHGRGALVNGHCRVLQGQARRANGALWYRSYDEFAHALEFVHRNPAVADALGRQGLDYVSREYRWPQVMGKLEELLTRLAGTKRSVPDALTPLEDAV
jgi:glycosyltransferase involved in cell wall biosynthesis